MARGVGSSKWCLASSSSSVAAGAAASPLLSPSLSPPPPPYYHHRPPPLTERSPRSHFNASLFRKEAEGEEKNRIFFRGGKKKKVGKKLNSLPPPTPHTLQGSRAASPAGSKRASGDPGPRADSWREVRALAAAAASGTREGVRGARRRRLQGAAGARQRMGRVQVAEWPLRLPRRAPSRPCGGR